MKTWFAAFVRMKLRNNTQKEYYKVVQRSKETPFETAIIEDVSATGITNAVEKSWEYPYVCGENAVCKMDVDQVPGLPRVCEENCDGTASKARKMKGGKSCETEKKKKISASKSSNSSRHNARLYRQ